MKQGPFASGEAVPAIAVICYLWPPPTSSRLPYHFPGEPVIGRHRFPPPVVAGPRRISPFPRTTFWPFRAHYAGGFLDARFRIPGTFHGLHQ
jgi:hypothetical protein